MVKVNWSNYKIHLSAILVAPIFILIGLIYTLAAFFDVYTLYFKDYYNIKLIITFMVSVFVIFYFLRGIVRGVLRKNVLSLLVYMFFIPVIMLSPKIILFEKISKIIILHSYYDSCIHRGVVFDVGKVFSVCDIHSWGYLEGVEQLNAVVYDSSDFIADYNRRDGDWRLAVLKYSKDVPFGYFHFNVTKIFNHYYVVDFGSEGVAGLSLPPDL